MNQAISSALTAALEAGTGVNASREPQDNGPAIAIIGSGFSGLGMAVALRRAGLSCFGVYEKAQGVGGTWRDNTYPGCACDVESALYSFGHSPNTEWSRSFAPQPEIRQYLESVSVREDLKDFLHCGHEMMSAQYNAESQSWRVSFSNGVTIYPRVLISAVGALHVPSKPEIRGLDSFKGEVFHSAEWRHDLDLSGKRVAVVGTGASAIQFVPQIAQKVKNLTLFQRTPAWVLPKPDRATTEIERKLYRRFGSLMTLRRLSTYLRLEGRAIAFNHLRSLLKLMEKRATAQIHRHIDNPEKAAKLLPDYNMGCKRILISNDYYPALNRQHVDINTNAISHVDGNAVIDVEGVRHEVDVIIYGTGFKTLEAVAALDIRNAKGTSLENAWEKGAEAHLGTMVSSFPNFFMLLGPNTGLGHNSQVYMIESQVRYVTDALRKMDKLELGSIDVKPVVQRRYIDRLQGKLDGSIWLSGCMSWYLNERGENWTLWPGFTFAYRWLTREFKPELHHCVPQLSDAGSIAPATESSKEPSVESAEIELNLQSALAAM